MRYAGQANEITVGPARTARSRPWYRATFLADFEP